VVVPSRGSKLIGGTLRTELTRDEVSHTLMEGFFPIVEAAARPAARARAALTKLGLPYAQDAAMTRHLAAFLGRQVEATRHLPGFEGRLPEHASFLHPTAVLFNGGVFKADAIRARVLELLTAWSGGKEVRELDGFQPDLAVAKGAAFYGRTRATGKGIRIKAGAARSYYVGLESSMPAIPGFKPKVKALCVVPQGMEEGTEHLIEGQEFGLLTGQTAEFRFFSSEVRSGDVVGQVLPDALRELEETSLLEVELPAVDDLPAGQPVPVQVRSVVTELGTLELWMQHRNSARKWKIEFQVRTE